MGVGEGGKVGTGPVFGRSVNSTQPDRADYAHIVYDWNHYFGLGPILKPKPKLDNTFDRYHNQYQNYILQGESSYR